MPPPADPGASQGLPLGRRLWWWIQGGWVTPDKALAAFERQHRRDELGVRIHTVCAAGALFLLTWPSTWTEFAGLPLAIYAIIRLYNTGPTLLHCIAQPMMIMLLVWAMWQSITLLWSKDRALGLDELENMRWCAAIVLLWPVIEHRRWLIGALILGLMAGHLSQVSHALGRRFDIEWMTWARGPTRNSGWWDPAVAGSILTAAMGLHLPAAAMGRGRVRWIGIGGVVITAIGLGATGTRGGWLASGALVGLTVVIAIVVWWRRARRVPLMAVGVVLVASVVGAGGAWVVAGESIAWRIGNARDEIAGALDRDDFNSPTGARILMLRWAGEATLDHPVGGLGLGGFRVYMRERREIDGIDLKDQWIMGHAHNTALHVSSTTGLIGLSIVGAICVVGLINAFAGIPRGRLGTYDAGPAFAMVGLLLVSAFDTIHVNQKTTALLAVLLALSPAWRPRELPHEEDTCESS